jgi:competence protein ComEA
MKLREFLHRIIFKCAYVRNEKSKQFFISVLFIMIISFTILTIILIKQNNENKIKNNILEAITTYRGNEENTVDISQDTENNEKATKETDISIKDQKIVITVYICGEIINPGVYELNNGMRINDLITIAGGITDNACLELINPAQKLIDGQKIYIPSLSNQNTDYFTSEGVNDVYGQENNEEKIININFATSQELESLPGIGEELAERIIEYREVHGYFESIDAIKKVSGIGDKKFNDIKEMITV